MAFSSTAVARATAIETTFQNLSAGGTRLLPQRVAVLAQGGTGTTDTSPFDFTSAKEVGDEYGFGTPAHLMALMLRPSSGDGLGDITSTIYPVVDAVVGSGSATASTDGQITLTGTQTAGAEYFVVVNGVSSNSFVAAEGDDNEDVAGFLAVAVNASINLPVTAVATLGVIAFTSKWVGISANDITLAIAGETGTGVVFVIDQQPSDATGTAVLTSALAGFGNDWVTIVANQYTLADSTAYDNLQTVGDDRTLPLTSMPFISFGGYNADTPNAGEVFADGRKLDQINGLIPALGSLTLPMQIAARAVMRIAVQANNNPARDYATQLLDLISPGASSLQLDYTALDASVKDGFSTTKLINNIVALENTVLFYHPEGEDPPAFRWARSAIVVMQIVFNIDLIFSGDEWAGAPLLPDDQVTVNPLARKPSSAKSALNVMIDGLARDALLSDPETAKAKTTASINTSNPDRLDTSITVQISGFTNIITIANNWGFFFGTASVA